MKKIVEAMGRMLCTLRFHKWNRGSSTFEWDSNVIDTEKVCRRCGKKEDFTILNSISPSPKDLLLIEGYFQIFFLCQLLQHCIQHEMWT